MRTGNPEGCLGDDEDPPRRPLVGHVPSADGRIRVPIYDKPLIETRRRASDVRLPERKRVRPNELRRGPTHELADRDIEDNAKRNGRGHEAYSFPSKNGVEKTNQTRRH